MVFPYLMVIHQINMYGHMLLVITRQEAMNQTVCATHHQVPVLHHMLDSSYYCESGSLNHPKLALFKWFTSDPLWDGMQCGGDEGPCGNYTGLPWFNKNTPTPATATINVRLCPDENTNNENIGIERLELFVK